MANDRGSTPLGEIPCGRGAVIRISRHHKGKCIFARLWFAKHGEMRPSSDALIVPMDQAANFLAIFEKGRRGQNG